MESRAATIAKTATPRIGLTEAVEALRIHVDLPALPSDPFQLVLWENMGALIEDARRSSSNIAAAISRRRFAPCPCPRRGPC